MNETVFREIVDNIEEGKIVDSRCEELERRIEELSRGREGEREES